MFESVITDPMTVQSLLICLLSAMVLGVLTALVFSYRSRHTAGFALTLALIPMIVTVIIMMVNGNVGTGIAVAGAFALVRFRSVPGTAREIAAIFTAMALGLVIGMGFILIAVLFFVLIAVFALVLIRCSFGEKTKTEKTVKITLPEDFDYSGLFDDVFAQYGITAHLEKIRTTNMGTLYELTYRAQFPEGTVPKQFVDELRARNGNLGIVIGEFTDREML